MPAAAPSALRRTTLAFVPLPLIVLPALPVAAAATTSHHPQAAPLLLVTVDAIPAVTGAAPLPPYTTTSIILSRRSNAVMASVPFPPRAVVSLVLCLVSAATPFTLHAMIAFLLGAQILAASTETSLPRLAPLSITRRGRGRSARQRARLRLLPASVVVPLLRHRAVVASSPVGTTAIVFGIAAIVAAVFLAFKMTIVASGRESTSTFSALAVVVVARNRLFWAGGAVAAAAAAAETAVAIGIMWAVTRRSRRRFRTRAMPAIVAVVLRSVPGVCVAATALPAAAPNNTRPAACFTVAAVATDITRAVSTL